MTTLSTPRVSFSLRHWATPLVAGAFLIMAATGVGMFFHLETDLMKGLHEWAGLAMVAGGAAHLWLNWRAFTTYFKRPVAGAIMGLCAVLLGVSLLPIGGAAGPGSTIEAMIGTVEDAPVTVLADLTGLEVAAVISALETAGLAGVAPDSTVAGLSGGDRGVEFAALAAVFAPVAE